MDKIFHHPAAQAAAQPAHAPPPAPAQAAAPVQSPTPAPAPAPAPPRPSQPNAPSQAQAPVDVEAVLSTMAQNKGGGGNWRSSIVDLLKLLDLDSSLQARKELADELNVHAGANGSAEENSALHRAVMEKLAQNGGKVPTSLRGG